MESAEKWDIFTNRVHRTTGDLHIAVVGKYFDTGDFVLSDAYISVIEAIRHAVYGLNKRPVLTWINAVDYEKDPNYVKDLAKYDGVIVPGGFGARGTEGINIAGDEFAVVAGALLILAIDLKSEIDVASQEIFLEHAAQIHLQRVEARGNAQLKIEEAMIDSLEAEHVRKPLVDANLRAGKSCH